MQPKQSKQPSYLASVKAKLTDLIVNSEHVSDVESAKNDLDQVWQVVRPAIAQSYWNGVEHGANGKVKPKSQR